MSRAYVTFVAVLAAAMLLLSGAFALAVERTAVTGHGLAESGWPSVSTSASGSSTPQGLAVMIVLADYDDAEAEVRDSLLSSGVADVVDHLCARWRTPTLAQLQDYDCVIVWPNYGFWEPAALGDVLADYVEVGGAVVGCQFCFLYQLLAGRFMEQYSPLTWGRIWGANSLGWYDPTHPIMENVSTCSEYFCYDVSHRGNVEDVARYDNPDQWPLVAANADYPSVVAINAYFGVPDRRWTGDMMRILLNSVVYAACGGAEVTMRCRALTPVFCRGKTFWFKLSVTNNTGGSVSGVLAFSGYGGYDCDPGNLLVAIPRSRSYPPGHTETYYYFSVPNAVAGGQYSTSVGGTLGGIDLLCCMNTDIIECSPFRVGDNTEWELVQVDRPEVAVPTVTALHQNYPNPFNAQTNISFSLAQAGDVNVKVYDISGRLVITLVEGQMDAGEHVVAWDASEVSSGVYFYKLVAGTYTASKVMNLLR